MAIKPNPTPWAVSTNTATESMATAKSTAEALGYIDLATATDKARYVLVKFQNKAPEDITTREVMLLNQRVEAAEAEAAKLRAERSIPATREFKCNMDFRSCIASASNWQETLACWVTWAACVGRDITTLSIKPD